MNNPLAIALSNINNAEKVGKKTCIVTPVSKIIKQVLTILRDHKYIGDFKEIINNRGNILEINLIGNLNKTNIIRPYYPVKIKDFKKYSIRYLPAQDFGIIILTTPKGIMTLSEAKKLNVGGKLLAYCY